MADEEMKLVAGVEANLTKLAADLKAGEQMMQGSAQRMGEMGKINISAVGNGGTGQTSFTSGNLLWRANRDAEGVHGGVEGQAELLKPGREIGDRVDDRSKPPAHRLNTHWGIRGNAEQAVE